MQPIQIPDDWDDEDSSPSKSSATSFAPPQRTVRDWRQRGVGPRWARFNGCGRLYITVAEARRFLSSATTSSRSIHSPGQEKPRD